MVAKPGQQAQLVAGGTAVPWVDPDASIRRVIDLTQADFEASRRQTGLVFFDRGLVDDLVALEHLTGQSALAHPAARLRYAETVFLAPPWPDICVRGAERRNGLDETGWTKRRLSTRAWRAQLPRSAAAPSCCPGPRSRTG
jgi:predicted ATPase